MIGMKPIKEILNAIHVKTRDTVNRSVSITPYIIAYDLLSSSASIFPLDHILIAIEHQVEERTK